MNRRLTPVLIFGLFLICCSRGPVVLVNSITADDEGDPVIGERITKGIAASGRLWLLGREKAFSDSGGLVSLGLTDSLRQVHFRRGVIDVVESGGKLWALRRGPQDRQFIVSVWGGSSFDDFSTVTVPKPAYDWPDISSGTLLEGASLPSLLSGFAVYYLTPDRSWRVVKLKRGFGRADSSTITRSGKSAYLGFDAGEFGGKLIRADLTGLSDEDEHVLQSNVTALIPDAINQDCVIVALGLVHMSISEGGILRVCNSDVTTLFERKLSYNFFSDNHTMMEAFYSLAPSSKNGFWAASKHAIYHFNAASHQDSKYSFPKLEAVGGIHLSKAVPDLIVVRSDVHWANSVSGYTPILVPLTTR